MSNKNTRDITVDRLWQGVSDQAPWHRLPGTLEEAVNVRSDIATGGAAERGAARLLADIEASGDYYWTAIRGAIVAIGSDGTVLGWNRNGVPLAVDGETAAFATYITQFGSGTPVYQRLGSTVNFDTLVVLNRHRPTASTSSFTYQQSLNYILEGDHTQASEHTATFAGVVQSFDDLPEDGSDVEIGDVYRVETDFELNPAGRYIFIGEELPNADYPEGYFPAHGPWYRIPNASIGQRVDGRFTESTMPHRIVYDETGGKLTVGAIPWRQRISGNPTTNMVMPWKGERIKSVEFFSSRLFLITDRHVTSSRKDDYFNLYVDNVNAVGDDDRVADNITVTRAGEMLRSAVCGQSILLLAENAQMEFTSGEQALTNISGRTYEKTSLRIQNVRPGVEAGVVTIIDVYGNLHQFRYMNTDVGIAHTGFLNIHRRRVLYDRDVLDIQMIDNVAYVMCEDVMLVHESFYDSGDAVQSAWSEFRLYEPVVFVNPWAGSIQLVTRGDEESDTDNYAILTYVHHDVPPPGNMLYEPTLDRLESVQPGAMTYHADADVTTVPHTGRLADMERSAVVLRGDETRHYWVRPVSIDESGHPQFPGNLTDAAVYLGFTYDTWIVLSPLYPGMLPYKVQTLNLYVFHDRSTDYALEWFTVDGVKRRVEWSASNVGGTAVGTPSFNTHFSIHEVQGDPRHMRLKLISDSPGRVAWMGVTYKIEVQGVQK